MRNLKARRLRDDQRLLAIRHEHANFGEMRARAAPVIHDRELGKPDRQLRDDNSLKDPHVRKLVADFQTHVVAEEGVNQFEFLIVV